MSNEKSVPLKKFMETRTAEAMKMKKIQVDDDYALKKLHELITDDITSDDESWIGRLLDKFLQNHGNVGYRVQDLPTVMEILEFLASRARVSEEYGIHLDRMLELCKLPPLRTKTCDGRRCRTIMERYFTTLGYLVVALSTDRDVSKVLRAVDCLLVRSIPEADSSAVKADLCVDAAERSRLPIIAVQLVEISSEIMLRSILELVLLLVANSPTCCLRMLEAGILNCLLIRMDAGHRYDEINENLVEDSDATSLLDCTDIGTDILWALLRSILSPSERSVDGQRILEPDVKATRSFRNILRKQVCRSSTERSSKDIMLRNDVVALILAGLVAFPSWRLVSSGLAKDLIVLSIATESGTRGHWTEHVKFQTNNEDDYLFKKIMMSIMCELCDRCEGAIKSIMKEEKVMNGILELINPAVPQCWSLAQYGMRILARLVPMLPDEFILQKGSFRLVPMLVQCTSTTKKFDSNVAMEFTKSMCNIISRNCRPSILDSFHEAGIMDSLLQLIDRILEFDRLTMEHQRILTLAIIIIEEVIKTKVRRGYVETFRFDGSVDVPMKLLKRCFYQRKDDFQIDPRLLIAIGSHLWECILACPENTEKFVTKGGTYIILDVIENSIYPVRCVYLGILTDVCSFSDVVISQLSTWRDPEKIYGLQSLLAKIWREEEIRTGVKRTVEGLIEDTEIPLMGTEQRINVFHSRNDCRKSPILVSIVGSSRPKIHAIGKIISSAAELHEKSKEHYKILLNDPKSEDRITMYIADQMYRLSQGQVWSEVSRYLEHRGVNLLGMDGEIMILMNERHCGWAMYVRGLQDRLLRTNRDNEKKNETNEIMRIRDSKLGSSLNALKFIDYVRRTTERDYAIRKKNFPTDKIDDNFHLTRFTDVKHCQSCLDVKSNVTTIIQDIHTIPSVHEHPTDRNNILE